LAKMTISILPTRLPKISVRYQDIDDGDADKYGGDEDALTWQHKLYLGLITRTNRSIVGIKRLRQEQSNRWWRWMGLPGIIDLVNKGASNSSVFARHKTYQLPRRQHKNQTSPTYHLQSSTTQNSTQTT
jgi:hypothetical protein